MIHNVWGGETGGAKDMRKAADLMDKMGDRLVNIYVGKTNKEESEIRAWMDDETWFTANEALEAGFINYVEEPIALAAKFDIKKLNYKKNKLVVDLFKNSNNKINKMEKQFEDLKSFISDLFTAKADTEVENVNVLDNTEVAEKIAELDELINSANNDVSDLTTSLGEKESNIIALSDEVKSLEDKLAKYEGTPTDIAPEKDPHPVTADKVVNVWDDIATNLI
tara:strand:- start:172 stop:840 length:669 start_codon:yes stop_codon:yes gene_type:complete